MPFSVRLLPFRDGTSMAGCPFRTDLDIVPATRAQQCSIEPDWCSSGPYLAKVYGHCTLGTNCGHQRCPHCAVYEDPVSRQRREDAENTGLNIKPIGTSARSTYRPLKSVPAEPFSDEDFPIFRPRATASGSSLPSKQQEPNTTSTTKPYESSTVANLVSPSFKSILSTMAQKDLNSEASLSCIFGLSEELTIAMLDSIIFTNDQPSLVDLVKSSFERRTGQQWDWWPCSPPKEPLEEHCVRVEWQTNFGSMCWRNVPLECKGVVEHALDDYRVKQNVIEDRLSGHRQDEVRTEDSRRVEQAVPTDNGSPWLRLSSSWQGLLRSVKGGQDQHQNTPTSNSTAAKQAAAAGNSNNAPTSSTKPIISAGTFVSGGHHSGVIASRGQLDTPGHVLLLVRTSTSEDYDLSQIKLSVDMTTSEFFTALRKTYLRSRGLARHFSIWRYHHCDFYRSMRVLPTKFTPHTKNNLPPRDHTDYLICETARMRDPPPILPIEFYWGYYLSNRPVFARLRSWWRRSGGQQDAEQGAAPQLQLRPELLRLLPRKVTQFDEAGVTQEDFWNILAVERICLRWVVFWNFVCMSPAIAFFFLWLFKLGGVNDLQNASVPITIVIMLEGLFWTLLWASTWDQDSTSGPPQTH